MRWARLTGASLIQNRFAFPFIPTTGRGEFRLTFALPPSRFRTAARDLRFRGWQIAPALPQLAAVAGWKIDTMSKDAATQTLVSKGDPWVDPQGILGGSDSNSGDPAMLTLIKIGGSGETTSALYNVTRWEHQGQAPAPLRILSAGVPSPSRILLWLRFD